MDRKVFETSLQFREWLLENCLTSKGIWILFGKAGCEKSPKTLTADEALQDALCFGWIDGQMKSVDERSYIKYFARRRKGSRWSEKNKKLIGILDGQGLMTLHGRNKVEEAKRDGSWDAPPPLTVNEEHIDALTLLLSGYETAYTNFIAMPASVKRTYAGLYHEAKNEDTRRKRLEKIVERLEKNLKPM